MKPPLFSNNGERLAEVAAQGREVTCLPYFILNPFFEKGLLAAVLTEWSLPSLKPAAAYSCARYLSLKARLFTDFLLDWFATDGRYPNGRMPQQFAKFRFYLKYESRCV